MLTRSFDYALAAASGVLLALSFPRFGHPAIGWIALAPLLVALSRAPSLNAQVPSPESRVPSPESRVPSPESRASSSSSLHPFMLGLIAGLIYFTGTLYWITRVMIVYGGLRPWVGVLVNAALIAYLALFPALFAVVTRRLVAAHGAPALTAAPLVWVAAELGRTHLLTGFPWVLLGYSQATMLPIAQLASIFGVYGVSALVAGVSAAASVCVVSRSTSDRIRAVVCVALPLLGVAVWGSLRAANAEWTRAGESVRVGLIQGNVIEEEKRDPVQAPRVFQNYVRMTREAIGAGAQLVIWPEASFPAYFEEDRAAADVVRAIARQAGVPILLGGDQIERGQPDQYFNSAFLIRADGTTAGFYRKMHLVPFGEYVPLKRVLFFAAPLVDAIGSGFAAGEDPTVLAVDGHRLSVAICYEIVYPNLVRQFVRGGSELVTTITNDAWFGRTSAPYQHFAQASMRAIEEGRYLVRSANTGISGIVDPYGRVLARSEIYEQTVILGPARFLIVSTFYARHGDIFAYASVAMTVALLWASRRRVK